MPLEMENAYDAERKVRENSLLKMDIKITPKNTDERCCEIRYFFLPFYLGGRLQRVETAFSGPIKLSVCMS